MKAVTAEKEGRGKTVFKRNSSYPCLKQRRSQKALTVKTFANLSADELNRQNSSDAFGNSLNKTLMSQPLVRPDHFFFGTRSLPCPYLEGMTERKVVTELSGPDAVSLYEKLSRAGFRRSHGLAYRPACPGCNACVPVRIVAGDFHTTRSFKRVLKTNEDLTSDETDALATVEQYRLFLTYQQRRHEGGDMSGMSFNDYRAMIEDTPVTTRTIEFRDHAGEMIAVMLMDRMEDSLSAVYSFFDARQERRSLGSFMILWMIEEAQRLGLLYVYLGYWIEGSEKMAYKSRFRPMEALCADGWKVLDPSS